MESGLLNQVTSLCSRLQAEMEKFNFKESKTETISIQPISPEFEPYAALGVNICTAHSGNTVFTKKEDNVIWKARYSVTTEIETDGITTTEFIGNIKYFAVKIDGKNTLILTEINCTPQFNSSDFDPYNYIQIMIEKSMLLAKQYKLSLAATSNLQIMTNRGSLKTPLSSYLGTKSSVKLDTPLVISTGANACSIESVVEIPFINNLAKS